MPYKFLSILLVVALAATLGAIVASSITYYLPSTLPIIAIR